jgi:hypothetical protein
MTYRELTMMDVKEFASPLGGAAQQSQDRARHGY